MSKDFVPDSVQNIFDWSNKLFDQIAVQGAVIGWTAAQITSFQTPVGAIRDAAQDVLNKQDALDVSNGALRQIMQTNLGTVRQEAANFRSTAGFQDGMGDMMGIMTIPNPKVDPNTYQPELEVIVVNGHARLMGKKRGVSSFNVYWRLQGATSWTLLAAKRVKFPFDDDSPVAHPGTPETREYQIIGVMADDEVGEPSMIGSALIPG